ncbi:hypothetical protein PHOSAC3_150253 [Mesotoga infera]|nr:hypothetical protein PHOSAC3_150253 [Mesotoga infera]
MSDSVVSSLDEDRKLTAGEDEEKELFPASISFKLYCLF